MIAETDEVVGGVMRAGNAGANNAEYHVVVLAAAIDQLPEAWAAGHRPGDTGEDARKLLVRAD